MSPDDKMGTVQPVNGSKKSKKSEILETPEKSIEKAENKSEIKAVESDEERRRKEDKRRKDNMKVGCYM